jgi:hypothetical protein
MKGSRESNNDRMEERKGKDSPANIFIRVITVGRDTREKTTKETRYALYSL